MRANQQVKWNDQQIAAMAKRIAAWREEPDGPVLFAKEACGISPTYHQEQLLKAIQLFEPGGGKFGVSAVSGQGCGKSVAAAIVICWFLVCYSNSLVHVTAPTEAQLKSVLWAEIEKLINNSAFLSAVLEWQATKVAVRNANVQWAALARTASSVESIQGEHRPDMLIVIDEASGIEDKIMEALLGTCTEPHNMVLMLSNPITSFGIFYDSHHKDRNLWHCLKFSSRQSPLVSEAHIDRMEKRYGKNSPIVSMRVDGDFPQQSDYALMQLAWFNELKDRACFNDGQQVEIGVDVARYGQDNTAVVVRNGNDILYVDYWHGADTIQSGSRIIELIREKFPECAVIKIDSCGVGGGLVDYLASMVDQVSAMQGILVEGVNVGERSDDQEQWWLLRDQLWCQMAERLKEGQIALSEQVDPEILNLMIGEMLPVEYSYKPTGARTVESKDSMRKKMGHSPDIADAMMLAFREHVGGFLGWI